MFSAFDQLTDSFFHSSKEVDYPMGDPMLENFNKLIGEYYRKAKERESGKK